MSMFKNLLNYKPIYATAVGAAILMSGAPALAQLDDVQTDDAQADRFEMDRIIVTASGREASLLETPISVKAFGAEQIARYGIEQFDDLAKRTPGLFFANTSTLTTPNPVIRGVGVARQASSPSVGVLIDGIDIGNQTSGNVQTFDLERIEVVRGPQSALFGRGVLAGAVNYITKRPSFDKFGTSVAFSYADGDEFSTEGRIEGPVTEDFALSLAVRNSDFDGFYENAATGKTIGGSESLLIAGSARLRFGEGDRGEAYLRISHSDEVQEQPAWHLVPSNSTDPVWYFGEVNFDETLIASNGDDYAGIDREFLRSSLIVDYDFDFATLTSRTSHSSADFLFDQDFDFTAQPDAPFPFGLFGNFRFLSEREIEDFSQEIRLTGSDEASLRWIVGGYYRTEQFDERNFSFTPASGSATPDPINPNLLGRTTDTLAVFGSLSADLTDAITATGELRWAQDEVTETSQPRTAGASEEFSETFENILPRFILEYAHSDDVMMYASAAKGNKPGGFNNAPGTGFAPVPDNLRAFDEEEAWSYELGVKSELFSNMLTLNAAVFYLDWSDIQVDSQVLVDGRPVGFTDNANSASSTGFEVEFSAAPTSQLNVYGGVSYSPIRIEDYVDSRVARAGITTDGDDQLYGSPDWTANLGAEYRQPIFGDWDGFLQADLSYNSTVYASVANLAETGDRTVVDLYLGAEKDKVGVTLFVNNLFDDDTAPSVSPFVDPTTFARTMIVQGPRPQQVGVRAFLKY